VTVTIADVAYGHGEGRSKKQAEQAAARAAYDALADTIEHPEPLRETHHG
jgi:dsRNA-specific ribonuclease